MSGIRQAWIGLCVSALLLTGVPGHAGAAAPASYSLVIDGDVAIERMLPVYDGTVYAPLSAVYGHLGMTAAWTKSNQTALIRGLDMTISMKLGSAAATVNGRAYTMLGKLRMIDGKLWFPILSPGVVPGADIRSGSSSGMIYLHTSLAAYANKLKSDKSVRASVRTGQGSLAQGGELLYDGKLSDGLPHGEGQLYRDGRLIYDGRFAKGMPEGRGIYYAHSGARYEGSFKNGWLEGRGKQYLNDKLVYDGEWKKGIVDGHGTEYDAAGNGLYEGDFVNGIRQGFGISFHAGTAEKAYEGDWRAGVEHGSGKMFIAGSGELSFIGRFAGGVPHGIGSKVRLEDRTWYERDASGVLQEVTKPTLFMQRGLYEEGELVQDIEVVKYIGGMKQDGTPHGTGVFYLDMGLQSSEVGIVNSNELIYEGDVRDGKKQGQGRAYDKGLVVYEGGYANDLREGEGRAYENGRLVYTGSWDNGVKSGYGMTYEYNNLAIGFSGTSEVRMTYGNYHFSGTVSNAKHYVYIGDIRDGDLTGKGKLYQVLAAGESSVYAETLKDGRRVLKLYDGSFVNGAKEGWGILYANGRKVYDGQFAKDRKEGLGVLFHSSGVRAYEGYFREDVMWDSNGMQYNENGSLVYRGGFVGGMREGTGTQYSGTVAVYTGDFKDDMRNGQGSEYSGGALVYSGGFVDGKRQGWGIEYDSTGRIVYEGVYRNGLRVTQQ